MIQNDCMTTYVDLICDRCFLCTHNSASLGLFPSAPARVHSNIDIDIDIDIDIYNYTHHLHHIGADSSIPCYMLC